MSPQQLARIALDSAEAFARLVAAGQVSPRDAWYAAEGARELVQAIAAGDVASDEEIERRREICRGCSIRVRITVKGAAAPSDWCGQPLKKVPGVSCGCLLAGVTIVASKKCWSGKWEAFTRPGLCCGSCGSPSAPTTAPSPAG